MPLVRGLLVAPAQLIGGIAAAGVVSALFPGPLNCSTRLGGGTSIVQGLFIEMFLTAQLVFVVIMLAVVKHKSTYLAPVGIGLSFFTTQLIGTSLKLLVIRTHVLTIHCRRLLHRRVSESGPVVGSRCDQPRLPRVSLDLLGRAAARLVCCVGLLPFPFICPLGEY